AAAQDVWTERAADLLQRSGAKNVYCLVPGVGSGRLIEELARQSDLDIIGIDPDAAKIAELRRRFDAAGLYGTRVALYAGDPLRFGLPPYAASLIVSEDLDAAGLAQGEAFARSIFHLLRPYGGTAYLPLAAAGHGPFGELVAGLKLPGAQIGRAGDNTVLSRVGALPGAADWTHEYGDPANTLMSQDQLVKAPLGVLWFGGPSSSGELFYNRHYWGPSMAVIGGRMFVQGPGKLTAIDVYTGRILWKIPLTHNENYNPGRRGNDFEEFLAGFHFLAVDDAIYLALGREILRIDPADGAIVAKFTPPSESDEWGRIRVEGDLILASLFRNADSEGQARGKLPVELIALNRHDGKARWTTKAEMSFPVVAVGGDRVFCFDGLLEDFYRDCHRKGLVPKAGDIRYLKAFDLQSGEEVWKSTTDMIATWIGYSGEKDVLMVSNKTGMAGFRGADGGELWRKHAEGQGFRGHPETLWDRIILAGDRVIDQRGPGFAYEIETGAPILLQHPITGKPVEWQFTKSGHHCNYAIANPHLLTFRAHTAGFCEIQSGNTARLEGFRSGCRNSLIPANGVLNAPNFAHGCVCGFPLFTSLALVHLPKTEVWSYSALTLQEGEPVERIGINFGAPGDRVDAGGTLWIDYPSVGGSSPVVAVKLTGNTPRMYQTHSAFVEGEDLAWVAASGVEGASTVTVPLGGDPAKPGARRYTVRLVFAEPDDLKPGERVFDVSLQGNEVLTAFDVVGQAGARNRTVVREFPGVTADKELTIGLKATAGKPILSGVQIVAEAS
ncbi:MAG: PQQ-binding-like beta-propeller repeat protein, partial [Planctomycetota bacterium]